MKLVSWNCRGLGNSAKIEAVKDLLQSDPADILLLQETKIAGQALLEISKTKWKKNTGIAVNARGSSGGLATLWREEQYQLISTHQTLHWIHTELIHTPSKLSISLINLYVPVNYTEKRDCWKTLAEFLEQETLSNIILAGDLNIVLNAKEKRGGTVSRDPMVGVVEELAQLWDLQDFIPIHGQFTWSNNRTGSEHISARLDRFLVQASLMNKKIISTRILPKLSSDHKPIQLCLEDEEEAGPLPFRFSPQWIERDGFWSTVKDTWNTPISGSASFVWEQKLKLTKIALKKWIKNPVPNPSSLRAEAVQVLHSLQIEMESETVNATLLDNEIKAQRVAYQSFRTEEDYWRMKSRSLWLKGGDRNTSFFHRQFRARLSKNYISEVKTSTGQVYKGSQQVKEGAVQHFQKLYTPEDQGDETEEAEFLKHIPSLVTVEENSELSKSVTEEEIIKTIWSMESDKAPGPDGFSIHFYKVCWDIIKKDLQKMIRDFMSKAKVGGSTNSTYLALIPKDSNPDTFARFRPISLCNASYKILAKLLANRMKPLLPRIISPAQGGFVKGRHILDNVIQVQETIHSSKQRKEKGMIIKLDMANAFDRVNRAFLCRVLISFGFSTQFVNLLKACMNNPWIAPLINGRPTTFFKAKRGIRQGCPLSPYLYIILAETLSRKLEAERLSGAIPGLKPSIRTSSINHALFADDSILLGGASIRIAKAFDKVIKNYCKVSGALVNDSKSEVYSWNIDQQALSAIAISLGFKGHSHWEKIKYLGLPIISGVNKRSLWADIISKFKSKISKLGGHWLTKGGKVILLKSQLSSLLIYQAAFLLAPKNIMEQISTLLRNFLWQGGRGNDKKLHLVNWETVKKPIDDGGLDIRDPSLVNLALGSKILWKILKEPSHPVSLSLRTKYTNTADLRNLHLEDTANCTLLWKLCLRSNKKFKRFIYRIPGNGKGTRLWLDRIMGSNALIYKDEIAGIREWLTAAGKTKLSDISEWDSNGDWVDWAFPAPPEQLQQQLILLRNLLSGAAPIHSSMPDRWGWGRTGEFSTSEGYRAYQATGNSTHSPSLWKSIWDTASLPKINFFTWTLIQNKILTGDNLAKRNFAGPHWCALCRCNAETTHHLFIECQFAKDVWGFSLQDFQLATAESNSIPALFADWTHRYPRRIPQKSIWHKIWNALPKYVCWKIWLARNQQIFSDLRLSPLQVAAKARALLIESVQHHYVKEDPFLQQVEKRWLGKFEPQPRNSLPSPTLEIPDWKLREADGLFQAWWRAQNRTSIFFDGASKGNPGPSGAGGIIFTPEGRSKVSFCWGLGVKTNNQAELLSLLKSCQIAREKGVKDIQIFGDSEILVKKLNYGELFRNADLNRNLERLKRVLTYFTTYKIYHILRTSNSEADSMANRGSVLDRGWLHINEVKIIEMPP